MTATPARLCKVAGCEGVEVDQRGRYARLCETHKREAEAAYDREMQRPLTEDEQQQLLAYIREHPDCSVREASRAVGVQRRQVRALRRDDPEFNADYHEARGLTPEKILAEIRRRAIDGVDEPVFYEGEVVGHIRRYSDRLLMQLGKAMVPELRDQLHLTGAMDGRMEVTVEHDFGSLIHGLQQVGILPGATQPAVDAAPLELLPARPD